MQHGPHFSSSSSTSPSTSPPAKLTRPKNRDGQDFPLRLCAAQTFFFLRFDPRHWLFLLPWRFFSTWPLSPSSPRYAALVAVAATPLLFSASQSHLLASPNPIRFLHDSYARDTIPQRNPTLSRHRDGVFCIETSYSGPILGRIACRSARSPKPPTKTATCVTLYTHAVIMSLANAV